MKERDGVTKRLVRNTQQCVPCKEKLQVELELVPVMKTSSAATPEILRAYLQCQSSAACFLFNNGATS